MRILWLTALATGWLGCATPTIAPDSTPSTNGWRGLVIAREARCSPYDRGDYSYPASVEAEIVALLGGIWSPYTGERFASVRETDIEHMVALSEAHDSGACAWSVERRRAFARDLDNLTLADPDTNRRDKSALDAADWMPPRSRCVAGRENP